MASMTTFPGGILDGSEVRKSSAYTVVITADSGKTFVNDVSVVYTLPSIAIGNTFTFVYDGIDGAANITLSPAAIDGITYAGSSTDDKDLVLTTATARRGDFVTISSQDGVIAWQVMAIRGTWVKQA